MSEVTEGRDDGRQAEAAAESGTDSSTGPGARLARRVRAFADRHGGAEAVVEHLGRGRMRVVLVGADGEWGDVVAPDRATSEAALVRAGVPVRDGWPAELTGRMRSAVADWTRMAGIQVGRR